MKHISKFLQYLKEGDEIELSEVESTNSSEFTDLKEEIIDMIKNSIKSDDEKVYDDFIEAAIKDTESFQIEGLINDSDVYEFYLKWRNEIDDILSDINFFDETPSEIKVFSLYDYIIQGTKKSVLEVISTIK
jgi:hypothetical protein